MNTSNPIWKVSLCSTNTPGKRSQYIGKGTTPPSAWKARTVVTAELGVVRSASIRTAGRGNGVGPVRHSRSGPIRIPARWAHLPRRFTEYAIATAWRCGFPAAISFLMIVLLDMDFLRGTLPPTSCGGAVIPRHAELCSTVLHPEVHLVYEIAVAAAHPKAFANRLLPRGEASRYYRRLVVLPSQETPPSA